MLEQEHIELSKHRIEKAEEMLKDAESLLADNSYRSSNNRAYYCIYHALRAVIALDGVEFKRHSGNIQYFQREYIKTGKFTPEDSQNTYLQSSFRTIHLSQNSSIVKNLL